LKRCAVYFESVEEVAVVAGLTMEYPAAAAFAESHIQRFSIGTLLITATACIPQPPHDDLPHFEQVVI
jgi:hypothetical protein